MAQGDTITITDNGDGTYSVATQEQTPDADDGSGAPGGAQGAPAAPGQGSAPDDGSDAPQTANSVADVLKLVKAELTEGGTSSQAMWQQEASGRDPSSGTRNPGQPGPAMSM